MSDFDAAFRALTGNPPFPWQAALYKLFEKGDIPPACNLPTGLGKTSVIAVWLIALANHPDKLPRRLVYVVNRRTVVDQTTDEVEKYKKNLTAAGITTDLALSTLRGQFADNREWSADPSRPAVICGTVDMIGSRLLFSGYGIGMRSKPLHAGFLGQDSLIVHDEAHLEPAFQELLLTIEKEQKREQEGKPALPWPQLRVMELTATPRSQGEVFPNDKQRKENEANAEVDRRIGAVKTLSLHQPKSDAKLAEEVAAKAMTFEGKDVAVLVFVFRVADVQAVMDKLPKGRKQQLTGTIRGLERDRMANPMIPEGCPIFARFLPPQKDDTPENERWKVKPAEGTVYLVCTSAGEVGVNISADHLVCDLTTFESMAQRFGRVNRFGKRTDTQVHVFHPNAYDAKQEYDTRRQRTKALLEPLDGKSVSPKALGELDLATRIAAFAPPPTLLPATDILFDAWALTTIRDKLPGRPPVEPYLHGLPTDWQPPETHVAWREEVEKLQPKYQSDEEREQRQQADRKALAKLAVALLEDFSLKPHEMLQDRMTRVRAAIDDLADKHPNAPAWVVNEDDEVTVTTLRELTITEKRDGKTVYKIDSRYGTILLPPSAGGLNDQGMLDPKSPTADDVSCKWYEDKEQTKPRRARGDDEDPPEGMRLVRRIELPGTGGEETEAEDWYWFARGGGDDDASKSAREPIKWQHHTDDVKKELVAIAGRLFPDDAGWRNALALAADWHDLGKMREVWQRSIGNPRPKEWYAKSGKPKTGPRWRPVELTDYRHEFGSLIDLLDEKQGFRAAFNKLSEEHKELVLHLIAAHHGRARPHFPPDEAFDPEGKQDAADKLASEVPQRFARLQRKYGRWGLAYLESLLRAADWAASANPSEFVKEGEQ